MDSNPHCTGKWGLARVMGVVRYGHFFDFTELVPHRVIMGNLVNRESKHTLPTPSAWKQSVVSSLGWANYILALNWVSVFGNTQCINEGCLILGIPIL